MLSVTPASLPAFTALAGVLVGALLSGAFGLWNGRAARSAEHRKWLREKRLELYVDALGVANEADNMDQDEEELTPTISTLGDRLNVLGGAGVRDQFMAVLAASSVKRPALQRKLVALMRRDLATQGSRWWHLRASVRHWRLARQGIRTPKWPR